MNHRIICIIFTATLAIAGATILFGETFPGTDDGANQLAKEFLKPGADCAALSKQLRPTAADYAAVFDGDFGTKVAAVWNPMWDAGQMVMAPKAGQTEVKISSATTEELKAGTGTGERTGRRLERSRAEDETGIESLPAPFSRTGKDRRDVVRRIDLRKRQLAGFCQAVARLGKKVTIRKA